jgi:KDO2-lipid IV(A) lauroyltransferase
MAKKSSTQIWLEYAIARSLLAFLSVLPFKASEWIGITAGSVGYNLLGKLRRVGERNLELAFPEKPPEERTRILKAAFRNMGRVMAVVSRFDSINTENIGELIEYNVDPEYAARYEKTKAEGRGRIILGGHIGNWELQAFSYPFRFEPLSFLARRMDNPRIEQMILDIRTRHGNKQIDKTNSASSVLRTLRSGGTVGVLADVNSHPKEGVFVPFFGIPACTATGIAVLALRANAVIVPSFAVWDGAKGRYSIIYDEMIEPINTGDRKSDIEKTTALCVAATERVIRKYPDQWIWIHRRWKTRPPGEKDLYE